MRYRSSIGAAVLAGALLTTGVPAQAFDATKYPEFAGVWQRAIAAEPRFDPSKPPGRGQGAPLTAEYQAKFEATLKDAAEGKLADVPKYTCLAPGMPMVMTAYEPMEIVVLPEITYILIDHVYESVRRIFTDGRDFPADAEASFIGYSIGKWIDTDGDGKFDVLEVETRNFKGPRVYDDSGLALHPDNMSIIKERISLDKVDRNVLHDEVTVIDNALTKPWTVMKTYKREMTARTSWREEVCAEVNKHIKIGGEYYMLDANGFLTPTRKNQPLPNMQHFKD
jgi:hypothetical protein